MYPKRRRLNRRQKLGYCEAGCGETDPAKLELDHWDNDRENNDPGNARTFCSKCHSIKSKFADIVGWAYARETNNEKFRLWVKISYGTDLPAQRGPR